MVAVGGAAAGVVKSAAGRWCRCRAKAPAGARCGAVGGERSGSGEA